MNNKLTCSTVPAILRLDNEWKVSPYGPNQPDRDAVWCQSRSCAERTAAEEVIAPREVLKALEAELTGLVSYLNSSKFKDDPTVQVADVLTRLEQLRSRAMLDGWESTKAILDGTAVVQG